jgi:hypothetical protein
MRGIVDKRNVSVLSIVLDHIQEHKSLLVVISVLYDNNGIVVHILYEFFLILLIRFIYAFLV